MKKLNAKVKIILITCLAILLCASGIVTAIIIQKGKTNYVTVSFETNGGSAVTAKTLEKGSELGVLETSSQEGFTFISWYYEPTFESIAHENDIVNQDITLYACWSENTITEKIGVDTEAYLNDVVSNYAVALSSSEEITTENLSEYLTVTSSNGDIPSGFTVSKSGNQYLVTPTGNYQAGCRYLFTLSEKASFAEYDNAIRELTVRVHKDEVQNATVNQSIKYISFNDLKTIGDDRSRYIVASSLITNKQLAIGDTLMLGDGTDRIYEGIRFVKLAEIISNSDTVFIRVEDADFEDVIEEIDLYFTDNITNDFTSTLDPEKMAAEVKASDAANTINKLVAATLLTSETFRLNYLDATGSNASSFDPSDFHKNASITETLTELSIELSEDMTVTVTIGAADNDNFISGPNPDCWCGVTFLFEYDGEVGDNVKVKCSFEFTQYLNISLQGYHEGNKLSSVKFDYALNIYSQTEVAFTALICSQSSDDEEEDDYFDITEEMENLLGDDDEEEEEDPETLMGQLMSMLEEDGDYIRLITVPFYECNKPVPPVFPILSLNLELDFVFDVKFGAGISTRYVNLDAVQIGICNDKEDGKLQTYKHKLSGSDRYSLDVEVCGYLGFKAGLEGQFGISFYGLDKLGEVGISIETGAYIDFWGYTRFHLLKSTSYGSVRSQISGGMYIDIGIYLDIVVYAKSDIFKVKAEADIVGFKWSLITIGEKDLLLYLDPYDAKVVMQDNYVSVKDLPNITGAFMDLTTGEISRNQAIDWSQFKCISGVTFLSPSYSTTKELDGIALSYRPNTNNYVVGNVNFYYNSPSLSFSAGTKVELTIIAPKAGVTVEDVEILGEQYKVDFYLSWMGEEATLIGTRSVWGGNVANGANEFYDFSSLPWGMTVSWDRNPYYTTVTENTSFTATILYPLTTATFTYFDVKSNDFVVAEYYISLTEPFTPPTTGDSENLKFLGWNSKPGMNTYLPFDYTGNDLYLCDADTFIRNCNQYVLTKSESHTAGELKRIAHFATKEEALKNYDGYKYAGYIYTAEYEVAPKTVTIHYKGANGENLTSVTEVQWGETFTFPYMQDCNFGWFSGYSTVEGGKVNWGATWPVTILENQEFYAVYANKWYTVIVQRWDETSKSFYDDSYQMYHGSMLTEEILKSLHTGDKLAEGVSVGEVYSWRYYDLNNGESGPYIVDENTRVEGHMYLYQTFERRVEFTIQAPKGATILKPVIYASDVPTGYFLYTPEYPLYVTDYNIISYPDDNDHHVFLGYRDEAGNLLEPGKFHDIQNPQTLVAVYRDDPIEYEVSLYTYPWVMDDGESSESVTVKKANLDKYIAEFLSSYKDRTYEDVTIEDSIYTFKKISVEVLDDFKLVKITFDATSNYINCTTTFVYGNGQKDSEEVTSLHTTFTLQTIYYPTTTGLTATFLGWDTDNDGIADAQPGDKYEALGDNKVVAVWDLDYEEYQITFILDNGDIQLGTQTYHYGDSIQPPALPAEFDGWVLDGWHDNDSVMPATMPAKNLTVHALAHQCFVSYEIDGVAYIGPTFTKALSTVDLAALPNETGYTYSDWYCEGIEIVNGKFVMPESDITFTTHKSTLSFNVTFYIDGKLVYSDVVDYNTSYETFVPSNHDDFIFANWVSDTVEVKDGSFLMPLSDVRLDAVFVESKSSPIVLYYINDELIGYTRAQMGTSVNPINPSEDAECRNFSGWICDSTPIVLGQIPVERPVTIVYGYYTTGESSVEFSMTNEETNYTYYVKIFGNIGDEIEVPMPSFLSSDGWKNQSTGETFTSNIYVFGEEPDCFIGTFAKALHTVQLEAITYYYTADTTPLKARVGDKVVLPAIVESVPNAQILSSGWLTAADITIDYDEGTGEYSFIMPDYDVYFYLYDNYADTDSVAIRLHVTYPGEEDSILVGTYLTYAGDYVNDWEFTFAVDGYTLGAWHFADGKGVGEFEATDVENGYDIYANLTLENVNIERCYLDGEMVAMFAKVGENYVSPNGREANLLADYPLPEREGYDYMGWLNFINGYSQGKLYHFVPMAQDTDLYNYSYQIGAVLVEVLLYNESLYGDMPFQTSVYLNSGDKIRLPLWDTEKYEVSIVATKNDQTIMVTMSEDEMSSYVTLSENLTAEDMVSISFYLISK